MRESISIIINMSLLYSVIGSASFVCPSSQRSCLLKREDRLFAALVKGSKNMNRNLGYEVQGVSSQMVAHYCGPEAANYTRDAIVFRISTYLFVKLFIYLVKCTVV